jgi:hypothetical protein
MSHSFFHRTVFIQPCHCIHSFLCSVGKWRNWESVVGKTLVAQKWCVVRNGELKKLRNLV